MYHHRFVGWNSRLDALQAAVLRVKLPHLDAWSAARAANAERYDRLFEALPIWLVNLSDLHRVLPMHQ